MKPNKLISIGVLIAIIVIACIFKCPIQKVAVGQEKKSVPVPIPGQVEYFYDNISTQAIKQLISEYREYSAEVGIDTVVTSYGWTDATTTEICWPTFHGFMAWLEKKYEVRK